MSQVLGSELGDAGAADIAWLTDGDRRDGDVYAGQTGETWFVLYFLQRSDNGFLMGEEEQWKTIASARLRSEALAAWEEELMAACPPEELPGVEAVGRDQVVHFSAVSGG